VLSAGFDSISCFSYLNLKICLQIFIFFPWRFRNENGNGLDLMVRLQIWHRDADFSSSDEQAPLFQQLWNISTISDLSSDTATMSIGAGISYVYTF